MEAPDPESSRAEFSDDEYQDQEVESTFHQPPDGHGEQEAPCGGDGSQKPESTTRESDAGRGKDGDMIYIQSTLQQLPVGDNSNHQRNLTLTDPIELSDSRSEDDDQKQVLESFTRTQGYNDEVEAIEMQLQTFKPSFNPDRVEIIEKQTESSKPADDSSTEKYCSEFRNQIIGPTFTLREDCEEDGQQNLLLTPQQYIMTNGNEKPESTIQRPNSSSADGDKKSQGTVEYIHDPLRVQTQPLIDGSNGKGNQFPQKTVIEQGCDYEDEIRGFLSKAGGIQFLQQLGQWMYPNARAADDEYQVRTTYMDGSHEEDEGTVRTNSDLLNALLSSRERDQSDVSLPEQLIQWHAAQEWINSFISMSLQQNDWYNAQNPSGEGTSGESSSYATHQMHVNLGGSGSLSVPDLTRPVLDSAPEDASLFIPAEEDGDTSHTMSSVALQMAPQGQWSDHYSQTQDETSTYATADLVSQTTSFETPLLPQSSHENWQYTQIATNLDLQKASARQMQVPHLLQNITPTSLQGAAMGWVWPTAASTVQIPRDVEENVPQQNMSTAAGSAWNSSPQVSIMRWNYVEQPRQGEPLADGDVEQKLPNQPRQLEVPMESTGYQGDDEKQQQCSCEECQQQQGNSIGKFMTTEGYHEQEKQCACEQCQLQLKGTGTRMISEGGDDQETQPQSEQWQMGMAMGVTFEGIDAQQRQREDYRWQDIGDGTSMRVSGEDVQSRIQGEELPYQATVESGYDHAGVNHQQQQRERWQEVADGTCMSGVFGEEARRIQREELQIPLVTGYNYETNDEQQGRSEGRNYDTNYDGNAGHQIQTDNWEEAVCNQQYYQPDGEQMHPGTSDWPINLEDDFEQQQDYEDEQEEEWDLQSESYNDEASERWQEVHARLKQNLTLWKKARFRARIVSHPLFSHLLQTHVDCIRLMAPENKQDEINQQLENVHPVYDKYIPFAPQDTQEDDMHIDQFLRKLMVDMKNYQTALENNLKVQATPTYAHLWRIERELFQLTGIRIPEVLESGPTMSDDSEDDGGDASDRDDDIADPEGAADGLNHDHDHESAMDAKNYGSYGPTAADRAAMETIRNELIEQLSHENYRKQIKEVRDEIMRKRRAGKLPDGTTGVLKAWWEAHSKWPYPTEEEKEQLIKATGLELKQVNNWFINQRKRNWHTNPVAPTNKEKRKAEVAED